MHWKISSDMLYGLLTGQILYGQRTQCFTKTTVPKMLTFVILYLPEGMYIMHHLISWQCCSHLVIGSCEFS